MKPQWEVVDHSGEVVFSAEMIEKEHSSARA